MQYMTDLNFKYALSDGNKTAKVVGANFQNGASKSFTKIKIPKSIGGYTVTEIGSRAFAGMLELQFLELPQTIQIIENSAFAGCKSLLSVTFYETKSSFQFLFLNDGAFMNCIQLEKFTTNSTSVEIYATNSVFADCEQLSFIDGRFALLGVKTFLNCSRLSKVAFAHNAMWKASAFTGCRNLTDIVLWGDFKFLKPKSFSWLKKKTIHCPVTSPFAELVYEGINIKTISE